MADTLRRYGDRYPRAHPPCTDFPSAGPRSLLSTPGLQDDVASNAIIAYFKDEPTFAAYAAAQTASILGRDAEDDEKLAAGIQVQAGRGCRCSGARRARQSAARHSAVQAGRDCQRSGASAVVPAGETVSSEWARVHERASGRAGGGTGGG